MLTWTVLAPASKAFSTSSFTTLAGLSITSPVTAHNHGFAVDAPIGRTVDAPFGDGRYGKVFVSHIDLNDDVVEGLQCVDIPAFSVQYHPEAAAGPHDAAYLFDRYCELMKNNTRESKEGK